MIASSSPAVGGGVGRGAAGCCGAKLGGTGPAGVRPVGPTRRAGPPGRARLPDRPTGVSSSFIAAHRPWRSDRRRPGGESPCQDATKRLSAVEDATAEGWWRNRAAGEMAARRTTRTRQAAFLRGAGGVSERATARTPHRSSIGGSRPRVELGGARTLSGIGVVCAPRRRVLAAAIAPVPPVTDCRSQQVPSEDDAGEHIEEVPARENDNRPRNQHQHSAEREIGRQVAHRHSPHADLQLLWTYVATGQSHSPLKVPVERIPVVEETYRGQIGHVVNQAGETEMSWPKTTRVIGGPWSRSLCPTGRGFRPDDHVPRRRRHRDPPSGLHRSRRDQPVRGRQSPLLRGLAPRSRVVGTAPLRRVTSSPLSERISAFGSPALGTSTNEVVHGTPRVRSIRWTFAAVNPGAGAHPGAGSGAAGP